MTIVTPADRPALRARAAFDSQATAPLPALRTAQRSDVYFSVPAKFALAFLVAVAWTTLSVWLSQPWLSDLASVTGWALAIFVITFVAYVPGFMNSFLISTILLDRRPRRSTIAHHPDLSILVACYNEADNVARTIASLALQKYPGRLDIMILDDGSTDGTVGEATAAILAAALRPGHTFRIIEGGHNIGKAGVLNRARRSKRAAVPRPPPAAGRTRSAGRDETPVRDRPTSWSPGRPATGR